jgi:hypothetical protein
MKFMMWLGTVQFFGPYDQSIWNIPSTNAAFWDAWFSAYQKLVLEYVAIANEAGVDYLCLGHNMGYVTKLSYKRWETLINAIRQAGFKGQISYFGAGGKYLEHTSFNTTEGQNDPKKFIELFDSIGITINSVIYNSTDQAQSRAAIKDAFANSINGIKALSSKPIYAMVATPSVFGATTDATYIEPLIESNPIANSKTVDQMQQADVYQSIFEYVNSFNANNSPVQGLFSWGYHFKDDFYSYAPSIWRGNPFDMAFDKAASIRGKPAENVVKWWFNNLN